MPLRTNTRLALIKRCTDPDWVSTPIGQLARSVVDTDAAIPITVLAELLGVERPNLYRWLLKTKHVGRSTLERESNNERLDKLNKRITEGFASGALPTDKITTIAYLTGETEALHGGDRTVL